MTMWAQDQKTSDELIEFLTRLARALAHAQTPADAFDTAFVQISSQIRVGVAVAVILEQNLSIYLSRNPMVKVEEEKLLARIRDSLIATVHLPFSSTEALVVTDRASLQGQHGGEPIAVATETILEVQGSIAGILALYRSGAPFDDTENRILELVSGILSVAIAGITARGQLQQLVDMDELTGVGNKRSFRNRLVSEVDRAHIYHVPLSLIMFDIDDFKEINDVQGHLIGDVVLSELSGCIKETLRPTDFFARFGGDEFTIILPHTDRAGVASAAQRVMEKVRELRIPTDDGSFLNPTVSLGAATLEGKEDYKSILKRADDHLYEAKRSGKNRTSM